MRTGHLFAGAGGGLYADLILGHTPVFAVEWDCYAAQSLQRQADNQWFPGLHVHHGDVQLFDTSPWKGRVDSIHAGFPCQDISVAGNGEGIEGERSGLWGEVKRIAGELRPRELFLENSPAITSRGLGTVLGDLAELGYDTRYGVLPASAVGAPHLRARWWLLARLMGDTNSARELQQKRGESIERGRTGDTSGEISNTSGERQEWAPDCPRATRGRRPESTHWWAAEPDVGRVANGVADRGNRIKCLGNGQVPLQAAAAYTLLSAQYINLED